MGKLDNLTPKQRRFVELYTGPNRGNALQSAKEAGYGAGMASELMDNEKIVEAVTEQNELQRKTMFYNEQDILEKLWEEATKEGKGSNQNGRIQALVHLGKHIGMWDDKSKALALAKEEKQGITYNIINFSESKKEELEEKVMGAIEENIEEVEQALPGIVIENYREE